MAKLVWDQSGERLFETGVSMAFFMYGIVRGNILLAFLGMA